MNASAINNQGTLASLTVCDEVSRIQQYYAFRITGSIEAIVKKLAWAFDNTNAKVLDDHKLVFGVNGLRQTVTLYFVDQADAAKFKLFWGDAA